MDDDRLKKYLIWAALGTGAILALVVSVRGCVLSFLPLWERQLSQRFFCGIKSVPARSYLLVSVRLPRPPIGETAHPSAWGLPCTTE